MITSNSAHCRPLSRGRAISWRGMSRTKAKWRADDPLFRGDSISRVGLPKVDASNSIVRHVLYLEGFGRDTPYLSTSEALEAAQFWAGSDGGIWITTSASARDKKVRHLTKTELLNLLRGKGKGKAVWHSSLGVATARRYVEEWSEHLLDFSGLDQEAADEAVTAMFSKSKERRGKS